MIVIDTTKAELKSIWKQVYRKCKNLSKDSMLYGYYRGKMEYTAWLLVHSTEVTNGQVVK